MAREISKLFVTLGVENKDFLAKMNGVQKQMSQAGKVMTGIGVGITAALGVSVKMAGDFDTAMREVNTMMGLSDAEFRGFSDDVLQLSTDMGVDAVESANALYQAISAGVPKDNAIDFLRIATQAAIGGVTDTETAVDGLTTVINAFKLPISDAQKVADLMFTTVKGGKTTFEELSASLFQVAPIAAASGVKFEEVSAALATMTKQGVPTSVATTQLRQAMVSLQKPSELMTIVMEKLGYESGQAMLEELGLAETLNTLRDATGGNNEQLMKMFGSVEAGSAVLSLTGENAEMFATDLEAMADSSGASTDAFEEMEKSSGRTFDALKESLQGVAISIGNNLLPILKDIVEQIKPIIQKVIDWMQQNPELTKTIILIVAAVGALFVVLGPILMMLPAIAAGFTILLGPVGLIIAGFIALIAVGILVWKNWDTIKTKTIEIWGSIVSFFTRTWDTIVGFFRDNWDKILAILFPAVGLPILIARNWGTITLIVSDIWDTVVNNIKDAWTSVVDFVTSGVNWLIKQVNKVIKLVNEVPGVDLGEIGRIGGSVKKYANGGVIPEPTLLYGMRSKSVYAMAGEAGTEYVTPGGGSASITVNIVEPHVRNDRDIDLMGERLVARLRQKGVSL